MFNNQNNNYPNLNNQYQNNYPSYNQPYGNQSPMMNNFNMPTRFNSNQNNYNDYGPSDMDSPNDYGNKSYGSLYQNSREGFIRKVYTILSIQLLFTAIVAVIAMNSSIFKSIFVNTPMLIIISVLLMAVSIVVACCTDFVRKYGLPILIVFTLLFALLVGIICAMTKSSVVLYAAGITAFLVISLTIFACVTKTDFTGLGPYLFVIMMVLFVFGIVLIFWNNPIAHLIYACLACLLYCVYLIFDTQLVLGKFENAYSFDDAYIAAIQLYIDVIQIFLQLIQIIGFIDN